MIRRRHVLPAPFQALLLAVALACSADAQRDFSQVTIEVEPVAGAVSMLTGSGGNIGVSAGEDGLLIVDDQFAELSERIRARLDELGAGGPRFVLNTHYHFDHTGGNANFGATAVIIAHDNVYTRLKAGRTEPKGFELDPAPRAALPVVTYADSVSVRWNGEEIRLLHLPASHTDGDSVVWFTGSRVAHLGDLFFAGKFPFVDLDSGGDVDGLVRSIGRLLELLPEDTMLIPGHGEVSTMQDLARYHRMLRETTTWVRQQMGAGRTLEQMTADGLPDAWDGWGDGFISEERWIATIHRAYSSGAGAAKR